MLNQSIAHTGMATVLALVGMTLGCGGSHGHTGIGPSEVGGALTVTSLVPNTGALDGTTSMTIAGRGFQRGATVTLDGAAAAVTVNSGAIIFAKPPAHSAGTVDLVVTNPDGASVMMPGAYTYAVASPVPPLTLAAISPNIGSTGGGTFLTITGTGIKGTGGSSGVMVELGGTAIRIFSISSTAIGGETGGHVAGQVDVVVTNADGQVARLAGGYTYVPPQSVDFNGDWHGFIEGEDDTPVRFTIRNNTLTSVSCGTTRPWTVSPSVPVINGEFSFSDDDGTAVSGRIVSTSAARGTIRLGTCTVGPWYAERQ
jgi:IPT/TIG domain